MDDLKFSSSDMNKTTLAFKMSVEYYTTSFVETYSSIKTFQSHESFKKEYSSNSEFTSSALKDYTNNFDKIVTDTYDRIHKIREDEQRTKLSYASSGSFMGASAST